MGLTTTTKDGPQLKNSGQGLLGVSYRADEAAVMYDKGPGTPTIYEEMVRQGLIDRAAYSLYLDDSKIGKGSILFGGVDSTKYTRNLTVLPLQPQNGTVNAFWVALTDVSISIVGDEGGSNLRSLTGDDFEPTSALFDSGTTAARIPDIVYNNLVQGLGAVVTDGTTLVPCSLVEEDNNKNMSVSFHFGGPDGVAMAVPLSALIDLNTAMSLDKDLPDVCVLLIGPTIEGETILGDAFLRSFYVVYDVANDQVAIATAALGVTKTGDITVIPTGTGIPGASSTATYMLTTAATTSSMGMDGSATVSSTSTVTPISTYSGLGSATFSIATATTDASGSSSASASSTASGAAASSSGSSTTGSIGCTVSPADSLAAFLMVMFSAYLLF